MPSNTTRNFLVPADGQTHTVWTQFIASAIPYEINWDQFSVDNFKFYPQGAFINNEAGASDLIITITPINYQIVVGAGKSRTVQFPAPIMSSGASIVGNGAAIIHWADFPTFPDDGGEVSVANSAAMPLYVAPATAALFPVQVSQPPDINVPVQQFAIEPNNWRYAAAAGGIMNSAAAVTFKAAAGAGIRNYVTGIQLFSDALGARTEIAIRDGAGGAVLWRGVIPMTGLIYGLNIVFETPLRGSVNTLLEVVTLTASVTGAVYFNAQGYTSTV